MPSVYPDWLIEETIQKFKGVVQLPTYENAIEKLIRQAFEENVRVGSFGIAYSRHETLTGQDGKPILEILIKNRPKWYSIREVVFDIMHELGHAMDPIKLLPDRSNERAREERAWAFANQQFASFPELQSDKEEYEAYKQACLATYLVS
jgi:hypothetical protein